MLTEIILELFIPSLPRLTPFANIFPRTHGTFVIRLTYAIAKIVFAGLAFMLCDRVYMGVKDFIRSRQRLKLVQILKNWSENNSTAGKKIEACNRLLGAFDGQTKTISLADLDLVDLPPFSPFFKDIHELNIHGNQIKKLPLAPHDFPKLRSLCWGNNGLDHFPEEISGFQNLTFLHLEKNSIARWPEFPEKSKLEKLITVDLSYNNISSVSASLELHFLTFKLLI